jgi:molecular chaperone Hsp33
MNREELIKSFENRDRVRSVLSKDGMFRASFVKNSNTTRTAQEKHGLDTVSAYLLSKNITAATLISSTLKGQERIVVETEGNGPVARIYSEASQIGEVRGFVAYNREKSIEEISHFDEAIGIGLLKVSRVLYNEPEPITGIVPIATGDIAKDIAHYYLQSEQIPTAILIDTIMNDKGFIDLSGGLLVQALPGADETEIERVDEAVRQLGNITDYLKSDDRPLDILEDILPFEFAETKTSQVDFFCRCTKDRFIDKLTTLSPHDLKDMQKEGQNELVCQFCGTKYLLEPQDFEKLINETTVKSN